jgi:Spy/CpxP family protein refolding chaperone
VNAGGWRSFALTLVVAAVIAAGAGFVGAKLGQTHAPARASVLAGSVRQSVDNLLQRNFQLTPDQQRQIQAIDEQFTRKHNLIWADIRTSNAELAGAVANDMSLNQQAKNAIMEIQDSVGRLHTESILYVLEIRKVLTPDQRNEFDEHIIMALMRDPA